STKKLVATSVHRPRVLEEVHGRHMYSPSNASFPLCNAQIFAPLCTGMSGYGRFGRTEKAASGRRGDMTDVGFHAEHPVFAVVDDAGHLTAPAADERTPRVVVGAGALHVVEGPTHQVGCRGCELTVGTPHSHRYGARCPSRASSARHGP